MKFVSLIMAVLVFVLSTLPCCLEDECICASASELYGMCKCGCSSDGEGCCCEHNNGGDCCDCCSPFVTCNTCTGVTEPVVFYVPDEISVELIAYAKTCKIERPVKGFNGSVLQPPRVG